MAERQKQIFYNAVAFLLLFFVSLYRQLSLRYIPTDPFRTYILYACYVILIAVWAFSVQMRVTQRNMRIFMMLQAGIIFFGATVRFLQDTFWTDDIYLTRISGLWLSATLLPLLLCGLYASLGIGNADSYCIPWKWYLLLIPTIAMVILNVTDEYHHFMFFIMDDEPQPNLEFYPNIGTFFMAGLGFLIMIVRILYIYRQNRILSDKKILRVLIPLFQPILIILFSFTYFVGTLCRASFLKGIEVLELYAKLYYSEILTWEFLAHVGLIPTNSEYRDIFEHATLSMQIILNDGSKILSKNAEPVSTDTLKELEKYGHIASGNGKEMYIHHFQGGSLLWSKDLSQLKRTTEELNSSAEMLAEEGALLAEELKTKNNEMALQAKQQIYNGLSGEVGDQLKMINELIAESAHTADIEHLLKHLYLLGTYVKRRCNLRLIQNETGDISADDLYLSLRDMISAMRAMGIPAHMNWWQTEKFSANFTIFLFDTLEQIIENEQSNPNAVYVLVDDGWISFAVNSTGDAPETVIAAAKKSGFSVECRELAKGYRIILTDRCDGHA